MYDFTIYTKNNTGADINIDLFNSGAIRGTFNSPITFSSDLTSADFNSASVSINVRSNASANFITYSANILTASIQGVVDALNSLGIGLFWAIGNTIVTANSLYTYGELTMGSVVVPGDLEITMNATAGIRTISLNGSGSMVTGTVDWGDGSPLDAFSSVGLISLPHNYTVNGTYVAKFNFTTPLTNLKTIQCNNGQIASFTGLSSFTGITSLNFSNNQITSIDVTALAALTLLTLFNNNLTTIDVTQNANLVGLVVESNDINTAIDLSNNPLIGAVNAKQNNLSVAMINTILIDIDSFGTNNGLISLELQTPAAAPTGAGATAKTNLQGRGWTVTTD